MSIAIFRDKGHNLEWRINEEITPRETGSGEYGDLRTEARRVITRRGAEERGSLAMVW